MNFRSGLVFQRELYNILTDESILVGTVKTNSSKMGLISSLMYSPISGTFIQ